MQETASLPPILSIPFYTNLSVIVVIKYLPKSNVHIESSQPQYTESLSFIVIYKFFAQIKLLCFLLATTIKIPASPLVLLFRKLWM